MMPSTRTRSASRSKSTSPSIPRLRNNSKRSILCLTTVVLLVLGYDFRSRMTRWLALGYTDSFTPPPGTLLPALCGPQTADLQAHDPPFLCSARVLLPVVEQRIAGGAVDHRLGDYTEAGIAQANRDDPDVMTAGALAFWRQHAINRPTIAYAVSVDHTHNLASVFNDVGVRAIVILGDTERRERDGAIAGFRDGSVKVLVNVIVATEGFDLSDAPCVIIARPTLSLALYLQMVGRGLRPKSDRGDCLILDLAANALTHGLPEKRQEWSLAARGAPAFGALPVVWCPKPRCGVASLPPPATTAWAVGTLSAKTAIAAVGGGLTNAGNTRATAVMATRGSATFATSTPISRRTCPSRRRWANWLASMIRRTP